MGGDDPAAVDAHGRVHGLGALRIADLSIALHVPRAPANATAFMIAERIADLRHDGDAPLLGRAAPAQAGTLLTP